MSQTDLFTGPGIATAPTIPAPAKPSTWDLRFGRWQDVLADVECDALIVDAPYSEKTHAGHDDGTAQTSKVWKRSNGKKDVAAARRGLSYGFLTPEDVQAFAAAWVPRVRGWFVTITDDVLGPVWAEALRSLGRYVFAPLPFVAPGSRVRLAGDGPSNWSCWIVVSRTAAQHRWGTLPGAYLLPAGHSERMPIVGGKPLWLMRALVRDYTRPGDLVCDPCAGGGTTLLAAVTERRSAIGAEMDPKHFALAHKRLSRGHTPTLFAEEP